VDFIQILLFVKMLKFSKKIKNIFLNFMKEEKESFEIFNFST